MRILILAAFGVALLLLPTAQATGPGWNPFERDWNPYVLDTQPGVVNNTGCAWGDQDKIGDVGPGSLNAGATTSDTMCLVADLDDRTVYNMPKAIAFRVTASAANFTATISNDVGNLWQLPAPVRLGNQYQSELCVYDPIGDAANSPDPLSSYWPQVPGTTGYGQIVNYTASVTASKRLPKLYAIFEIHGGGDVAAWAPRYLDTPCPAPDHL